MPNVIIFTGLVRQPDVFSKYISEILRIDVRDRPRIIYATWQGEIEKYPELLDLFKAAKVETIDLIEPNIMITGHAFHQSACLDAAVGRLDDNDLVLRLRPDMYFGGAIDIFERAVFSPRSDSALDINSSRSRIYLLHINLAHPFLWNDTIFICSAASIRDMASSPMIFGSAFAIMAAEQWLWTTEFMRFLPAIDAYFRTNPFIIFNDEPRIENYIASMKRSPLFAAALAANIYCLYHCCDFMPFSLEIDDVDVGQFTLEELIWGDVGIPEIIHHKPTSTNLTRSPHLISALYNCSFAESDFGSQFNSMLKSLCSGDSGSRELWRTLASDLGTDLECNAAYPNLNFDRAIGMNRTLINGGAVWKFKAS